MSAFTRSEHNTSFIAYESAPSRKPVEIHVNGNEMTTRVHPEAFITEYPSVLIKSVNVKDDLVSVTFDASSVETRNGKPLSFDFHGNCKTNSPLHQLADAAREAQRPVYVAFEIRRKVRNRAGDYIAFTTPINTLRGCNDNPDGKATTDATSGNCSKVIAVLGFADEEHTLISEECRTNPLKWGAVRGNYDGTVPPQGCIIPKLADGSPAGCIIQASEVPTGGMSADVEAAIARIEKQLTAMRGAPACSTNKPWMLRGARGEVNPGSYAVTHVRRVRSKAHEVVSQSATSAGEVSTDTVRSVESLLTKALLWVADTVQARMCGRLDRMDKAWDEACQWAFYVVEAELPLPAEVFAEQGSVPQEWSVAVRNRAFELFAEAVELTAEYCDSLSKKGRDTSEKKEPAKDAETADARESTPMLSDSPELRKRWDDLIVAINMGGHVAHLNPALVSCFGTYQSAEIPAEKFEEMLSQWEDQPQQFVDFARNQYQESMNDAA